MKYPFASFFLLISTIVFSQSTSNSIGVFVSYHPEDFYTGIQFSKLNRNHFFGGSLGTGVNKTIFLNQVHPKISAHLGLSQRLPHYFEGAFLTRFSVSYLNLSTIENQQVSWFEPTIGLLMTYGKKYKISLGYYGGVSFRSIKNKVETTWNQFVFFSPELSFNYVF